MPITNPFSVFIKDAFIKKRSEYLRFLLNICDMETPMAAYIMNIDEELLRRYLCGGELIPTHVLYAFERLAQLLNNEDPRPFFPSDLPV